MRIQAELGDCLEIIPRLVADGVVVDASSAQFLDDAGITYHSARLRGGDGARDRLGRLIPGEVCVTLTCGQCSAPIERCLGEIRHLVTKRGTRAFFCNRACKDRSESVAQIPPDLVIPGYLRQPIAATSELELGKAAEHLVCAELIIAGYRAYLSDQGLPYDVGIDINGRLIRVQVKSTSQLRLIPQRAVQTPAYLWNPKRAGRKGHRQYGAREFDIVALVALDIRCIAYLAITSVVRQTLTLAKTDM